MESSLHARVEAIRQAQLTVQQEIQSLAAQVRDVALALTATAIELEEAGQALQDEIVKLEGLPWG